MFISIKKNDDFLNVYHNGKSYVNKYLVMYIIRNGSEANRYGITASKKIGNSVIRHRITRLIRESIRLNQSSLICGFDIVIVARKSVLGKKFSDIESAFLHLCKLHHILKR